MTDPSPDNDALSALARKMWRTLEPFHGMIYFTPEATAAYANLGVNGQDGYFASRAAALGRVPAEVVISTFYNFHPALVRRAIPAAWDAAGPHQWVAARRGAVDAALRDMLGVEVIESGEMREAAVLARAAVEACEIAGRPLFAAHAALDWPERSHVELWHAISLLREFRGDGHIAALLLAGIGPCESLITHGATPDSAMPLDLLKLTRGWPDSEWNDARERLEACGWVTVDGLLTEEGNAVRSRVEQQTDVAAISPWSTLGTDACDRLRQLVRPWSKAIVASGVFLAAASLGGEAQ